MNDFLEIYTRLKMATGNDISLTYYQYGCKQTQDFKLKDVSGFSNILVEDDTCTMSVPFFGINSMIESITIVKSNKKLYFNPYIDKEIFQNLYIKKDDIEAIKKKIFGNTNLNLEDREKFIQRFQNKDSDFILDDLFFTEKQKREFNEFFKLLVEDITRYCQNNNIDSNLELIGCGSTSIIYSIGDKIIKIGKPRRTPSIPYCEYLLQPIINTDYEFDGFPIHVEVTQKVIVCENIKNSWSNEKFVEIRNELARKLSNIGLKSTDLHPANIGILTSKNNIHFNSIQFEISSKDVTSIQNNNNLKILGPGDYVIIDLDCLEIEDINKYNNYLKSIGLNINIENNDNSKKR